MIPMESTSLAIEFLPTCLTTHFHSFGYINNNNAFHCRNVNIEAHYNQGFDRKGSE